MTSNARDKKQINISDIIQALSYVAIVNNQAKEIIETYFKTIGKRVDFTQTNTLSHDALTIAREAGTIRFDDDVKLFKKCMEDLGYGLNVSISSPLESKNEVKETKESETMPSTKIKLDALKAFLSERIHEAELAKEKILDGFTEYNFNPNLKTPISFLFCGDKSSGKSYIATVLGDFFKEQYGYDIKLFDMAKYTNSNQDMDIVGVDRGYTSAGNGKVTSQIFHNPKTVLILENFDQAHHNVQNRFESMLKEGYIKDNYGFLKKGEKITVDDDEEEETKLTKANYDQALEQGKVLFDIDCKDSIIIFTTRRGEDVYRRQQFAEELKQENSETFDTLLNAITSNSEVIRESTVGVSPGLASSLVKTYLTPLFPIGFVSVCDMVKKSIAHKKEYIETNFKTTITLKDLDTIAQALVVSGGPDFDVMKILKVALFELFDPITDALRFENSLENISIAMEEKSLKIVKEWVKNFGEEHLFKILFRKSLKAKIVIAQSIEKNTLSLGVSVAPELIKAIKASDYGDSSGALVFEIPNISFADIAGHLHAKNRLKEIVTYLKYPDKLEKFGISSSKGMLLYGPPGTGKTILAKAFAHEADLPFISTTGSEILNIELMKKIFKRARDYAPSIIFIDEIDAIGSRDGSGKDIIINQFLTELNGFSDSSDEMVFVISATNLKEKIDAAILRSGRIDLHVEIASLDKEARKHFIEKILQKPSEKNINVERLITFTAGMTGADLEKVGREASLEVIRKGQELITEEVLIEQINTIKYGEKIISKSIDKIIEGTAYHEAAHAVISKVLMPDIKIEQITVIPRNNALGFVSYTNEDNFSGLTYEDIKSRISIAFAGRIAQIKKFDKEGLDSGASNDLLQATKLAYYGIAILGMHEEIGYINLNGLEDKSIIGGIIEHEVQIQIKNLLKEREVLTKKLVDTHWKAIESVAKELIANEFLDEGEFLKIISK